MEKKQPGQNTGNCKIKMQAQGPCEMVVAAMKALNGYRLSLKAMGPG